MGGVGQGREQENALSEMDNVPWVGIHMKCFDIMQRLLEHRTSVLHLPPEDTITQTYHKRVPASLNEMYEVYQSRIFDMPDTTWRSWLYEWKVLEPHRYYYNNHFHGDKPVELFEWLEWPWGSQYTNICAFVTHHSGPSHPFNPVCNR